MTETSRTADREMCFIRAFVNGCTGQVRDITARGMKISLYGQPDISPGESINVKLIPDESMNMKSFYVRGTVRWVKKDPLALNFGFLYTDGANMSVRIPLKKIIRIWK